MCFAPFAHPVQQGRVRERVFILKRRVILKPPSPQPSPTTGEGAGKDAVLMRLRLIKCHCRTSPCPVRVSSIFYLTGVRCCDHPCRDCCLRWIVEHDPVAARVGANVVPRAEIAFVANALVPQSAETVSRVAHVVRPVASLARAT